MRRSPSTFLLVAMTVLSLAAAGIVLLSYRIGNPLPTPLPQLVVGLGAVSVLVILMLVPVLPFNLASSIEIALPHEQVYDRLADAIWWAARNPALRRLEVIYARTGGELVQVGTRSLIGRRNYLWAERVEAERPNRWVTRNRAAGTRTLTRTVLSPTPKGTLLERQAALRISVFIWVAWLPRRRMLRETYVAGLAMLKADLESGDGQGPLATEMEEGGR